MIYIFHVILLVQESLSRLHGVGARKSFKVPYVDAKKLQTLLGIIFRWKFSSLKFS